MKDFKLFFFFPEGNLHFIGGKLGGFFFFFFLVFPLMSPVTLGSQLLFRASLSSSGECCMIAKVLYQKLNILCLITSLAPKVKTSLGNGDRLVPCLSAMPCMHKRRHTKAPTSVLHRAKGQLVARLVGEEP